MCSKRMSVGHRYAVEQRHDASMASRGLAFLGGENAEILVSSEHARSGAKFCIGLQRVDLRAAQLAICSTSTPPPRTESACFECRVLPRVRSAAAVVNRARVATSFIIN